MEKPKFTIVTITYNSGLTVERTIKSILDQNYNDYEYIIIDGASKDNTIEIVRRYEPMFNGRLKWISEPDKGIYEAMNKGINRALGEIIGIVNSDDWLAPDALSILAEMATSSNNNPKALYCGSINFHYDNGTFQEFQSSEKRFLEGIPKFSYNYGAYHPAIFVNRHVYESIGCFDDRMRIIADIEFIYRCFLKGMIFKFTDKVLSNMSDGGTSNNLNLRVYLNDKRICMKKYHQNSVKDYLKLYKIMSKLYIKQYLPDGILKTVRNRHLKNRQS